jgi:hypothetical protein
MMYGTYNVKVALKFCSQSPSGAQVMKEHSYGFNTPGVYRNDFTLKLSDSNILYINFPTFTVEVFKLRSVGFDAAYMFRIQGTGSGGTEHYSSASKAVFRLQEVPTSNIDGDTVYPDSFHGFPRSSTVKQLYIIRFLPNCYSPDTLP